MAYENNDLNWDNIDSEDEVLTTEILNGAASMEKIPAGEYICECVGSKPVQKNFANYSCIAANLHWQIIRVNKLGGKEIAEREGAKYIGRKIYDDIALYSASEKTGMRNRRILFAKNVGLINDSSQNLTKKDWQENVLGKRAVIDYIDETYTPKNGGGERTFTKVAFNGYSSADEYSEVPGAPLAEDI